MSAQTTPFEAGLGRFVKLDNGDFIGREALMRQKRQGLGKRLASLSVEGNEAIPRGWEPLFDGEAIAGYVTSGEYCHALEATVVLASLRPDCAEPGTRLEIEILGERFPARVVKSPIYDPANAKMKV